MKTSIMGKSVATAEQMSKYLLSKNPNPKIEIPALTLCKLYLYLGALEGVRGDLEFCRSCWETNYFSFTGTVVPEQNNFCGHGTTSSTNKGSYFSDAATGILVQIQHAKAYATADPLTYDCLDDRYKWVKKGSAPYMEDMGGKWAVPGYDTKKYVSLEAANEAEDSYGYKILGIYQAIVGSDKTEDRKDGKTMSTIKPLSGKKICIDAGHYGNYNRCPAIPEYYESIMAWKLHLLQKKYLEQLGATVIVTRVDQKKDLALYNRGAASKGCDLFISDHSNAIGRGMNESIDYAAVYHLTDDTSVTCDDISKAIAKKIAPVIANVMGLKQGCKVLSRKSGNDRNHDGVMNDNYYGVLHGARMVGTPGLILEHGFHTNSATVRWLLNDANLDKLAKAEAEAIAEYFYGKKVTADSVASTTTTATTYAVPYTIKVANVKEGDVLNIRKEPNANSDKTGSLKWNDPSKYTIVEEKNGWGKLKSGIGWVNLKYTMKA